MKSRLFLSGLATTLSLLVVAPAQAGMISGIVAFGDSLSDNGASLTPTNPLPRASDGPVAVEYMGSALGLSPQVYAVNGARTDFDNSDVALGAEPGTGVRAQVGKFIGSLSAAGADPMALYIVSGGSNDALDAVLAQLLTGVAFDPVALATSISVNLGQSVIDLYTVGARNFLLPLLPDLGLTPVASNLGLTGDLSLLSGVINFTLASAYTMLLPSLADASFTVFDLAASQQAIVANPTAFGLTNVTDACLAVQPGSPPDCSSFFFWDELHPTTAASALVAQQILGAVGVPAPTTFMLAVLGLALLRRRSAFPR
jgi:phospholipase/lecithinase/hemolysin